MGEGKHTEHFRDTHLQSGEQIVAVVKGFGGGDDAMNGGELIVTDRRVVFCRKGFFGGEMLETIPLGRITSIEQKRGFMGFSLCLHTANDSLGFRATDETAYRGAIAAIEAGRRAIEESSKPAADSPIEMLKKLGELKAAGVVSEAEFEEKKRQLLERM